ncbi:PHB depolymerase family esterase, partial [Burkholderia pseudomallei]
GLAMRYPELFAAVGLHSGPVCGAPSSTLAAMSLMRGGSRDDPLRVIEHCVDVADHPGMPARIGHGEPEPVVAKQNP